jgi:hypothetical protein
MNYDWLPVSDSQLLLWMNNFRDVLTKYQGSLGLSPIDILGVEADYKALAYMENQISALRAEVQTRAQYKNFLRDGPERDVEFPYPAGIILAERPDVAVKPGIVPRLIRFVDHLRNSSGYTELIGQELGIEPKGVEQVPTAPDNIIPLTDHGMVRLDFSKATWQGVIVESQRDTETDWKVLGTVFETPFVDARPPVVPGVAEARRYRLRYVDSEDVVGAYSAIIQVIVPADAAYVAPTPGAQLI